MYSHNRLLEDPKRKLHFIFDLSEDFSDKYLKNPEDIFLKNFSEKNFLLESSYIAFMYSIINNYNTIFKHLNSLHASLNIVLYFLENIKVDNNENSL